jgi:tetratricopeptide (TPR) repeat protein
MPIFATSASRAGIEAASDVHHYDLDEALGQLVEMSLVDATDELDLARRRYSIHPLTRAFAEAKLKGEPEALRAAHQRLAEYFQSFTQKHGGFWSQEGFDHLEPELPNILATIRWCWEQRSVSQFIHAGVDVFLDISSFMIVRGYWDDAMILGQQGADLASEAGDEWNAARLQVWPVAWIYRHRGDLDSAEKHVLSALPVFERLDELRDVAFAKRHLGRIASERGDFERADELLEAALIFYQSAGDERQIYIATANLAEVALKRGNLDTAWALCSSAVASARRFDDPERIAALLGIMGGVARRRADIQQAHAFAEEALAFMKRVDRRDALADALSALAQIEMDMGQKQSARQLLSDALDIYERLDIQSKVSSQ